MSKKIILGLKELETSKKLHLEIASDMLNAYKGKLYPLDLLAVAVFKRSLSLISGFSDMIRSKNFICAAPLIRLQLDNLLRFYAAYIVHEPHKFASEVIKGKQINQLEDKNGISLTDKHLVESLSNKIPWVKTVYKETSGYIHLSDKHIFNTLQANNSSKNEYSILIEWENNNIPNEAYEEAIGAMIEITKELLKYLHGWAFTKDNPQVVEKMRKRTTSKRK